MKKYTDHISLWWWYSVCSRNILSQLHRCELAWKVAWNDFLLLRRPPRPTGDALRAVRAGPIGRFVRGWPWEFDATKMGQYHSGGFFSSWTCHEYSFGWWFQTFDKFSLIYRDNPSHWLIFFKMVKTTNQSLNILELQIWQWYSSEEYNKANKNRYLANKHWGYTNKKWRFSPPARWGLLDFMSVAWSSSSPLLLLSLSSSSRCPPRPPAQLRLAIHSVLCRTSTTTIHAQCSLPDLNHDHPRPVFPAGPQPRPSPPSVPCRTSTTTIHAQCSLPDLNREYPRQVFPAGPHVGRYGTKNVQKKVRKNVRKNVRRYARRYAR